MINNMANVNMESVKFLHASIIALLLALGAVLVKQIMDKMNVGRAMSASYMMFGVHLIVAVLIIRLGFLINEKVDDKLRAM